MQWARKGGFLILPNKIIDYVKFVSNGKPDIFYSCFLSRIVDSYWIMPQIILAFSITESGRLPSWVLLVIWISCRKENDKCRVRYFPINIDERVIRFVFYDNSYI